MDKLEIKIILSYKVPENGLTINGILRGLQEDQNKLMRNMVKAILSALEKETIDGHISSHMSLSPLFYMLTHGDN